MEDDGTGTQPVCLSMSFILRNYYDPSRHFYCLFGFYSRVSLKMEKSTNIKKQLGNDVSMSYEQNKKKIKILAPLFGGVLRVFIL